MVDHKDRMYTPFTTKDRMDELVSVICETHQLMESTVRDMLQHGWVYHDDKWVKHKSVNGSRPNQVIFDEANQFLEGTDL